MLTAYNWGWKKKVMASAGKWNHMTNQKQLQIQISQHQQLETSNWQLVKGQQSNIKHTVMSPKSLHQPHVIFQEEEETPQKSKPDPQTIPKPEQQHGLSCRNVFCPSGICGHYCGWEQGTLLEYKQLSKHQQCRNTLQHSYGNEIGRLAWWMTGKVQGMNTIFFINKQDVPQHRCKDVTYGCIVCNYCKGKAEPNRTRLIVRGDRINRMPTAGLIKIKLLLNNVISTHWAQFMMMDIKNCYLNTPSNVMNISDSSWRMYKKILQKIMS